MNLLRLSIGIGLAATMVSCTSVPLPPEAAAVTLERTSSGSVTVREARLIVSDGRLFLVGSVTRQCCGWNTKRTHLDVTFFDAADRPLRRELTYFAPRDLRLTRHGIADRGHYLLRIVDLPAGTTKIQVRAHNGNDHPPVT